MAFTYSYDSSLGQKKGLPSQTDEPLLQELADPKKTYMNAIVTLRKKLRLQREVHEKDLKIAQQAKEIEELKQKLLNSTPR
ncbi:MAG TPA: hypothetical protein VFP93_00710, partial [Gammaproteobacteria bacterium]|nr:hypothetical protein [Gammaproteobacteria bacterium]